VTWYNDVVDPILRKLYSRYLGAPERVGILHIYMQAKGASRDEFGLRYKGEMVSRVREGCYIGHRMLYRHSYRPEGTSYRTACDRIINKSGDILWLE